MNQNPKLTDILTRAGDTNAEKVLIEGAFNVTNDGDVVPADDERGAFVLVGENGSLPKVLAEELKLPIRKEQAKAEAATGSGVTFTNAPAVTPQATDTNTAAETAAAPAQVDMGGKKAK
jgi:hypothetical protein